MDILATTRRLFTLGRQGSWEKALDVLNHLQQQRIFMDAVMCSAMCTACETSKRWDVMLELQEKLAVSLDTAACTALMKLYGRCSEWPRALQVFSSMLQDGPLPDTFALGALVASVEWHVVLSLLEAAWLATQWRPNVVVYNSAIASCGSAQWQVALALMEDLEHRGLRPDAITCGSLVAACEGSEWPMALQLLKERSDLRNMVSASTVISACAKAQETEIALSLLQALPGMQIQPSAASFNAASISCSWQKGLQLLLAANDAGIKATSRSFMAGLKALEKGSCWQTVLTLMRGDKQLGIAIRACHEANQWQRALNLFAERMDKGVPPLELWNAAMACQGNWPQTLLLFSGLQQVLSPDAFSYNLVMKACEVGCHWQGALALLQEMRDLDLDDVLTYHMTMTACMESWRWETCLGLLQELEGTAEPGLMLYGPAVGACSRTLQWEHALLLVHRLWAKTLTPDTTMMNVVITVCERSGHWAWSLQLLKQSRQNGPAADRTTCNAVINACATGSCWETALQLLRDADTGEGACDVALGSALRACSLARRWEEALQLPRRNLVAHFALLDACSGFAWLPTPQLTEETRISLASKGGGDDGKTIMAAVTEQLQDLNAFGDHEVASLHAFQAPVTRRLLALTRSVPLCVMDLGGEVVLRDRLLERQSSLGPFFVEDFLSQIGCDPLKAFLEEARVKSRRSMEGAMISGDPMAKDIVTYVASTLGVLPEVFCGGRRWVGGYRAESWKALPALYVEHHRFPHAERQALLDLLSFAKRMMEITGMT